MGLKSVISSEFEWNDVEEAPFKFDGHTPHRPKFLENRDKVAGKYFLPHKLIRNIISKSSTHLPEYLCDFKIYKNRGFIEALEFFTNVDVSIKKGAIIVTNTYYASIVKLVTTKRYLNDVPSHLMSPFIHCASKLLAAQIVQHLMLSINHFMDVLDNWMICPSLKLELRCENHDLFFMPLRNDFCSSFHEIIDKIANVGMFLAPLESWLDMKTDNSTLLAIVPDWFLEKSHNRLAGILEHLLEPLDSYVNDLKDKFGAVYRQDTRKEIEIFIAENQNLDDSVSKVEVYDNFIRDINGFTENEYFKIGMLGLNYAKEGLKNYAREIREHVIFELRKRHWNFNMEICGIFEGIEKRALTVPRGTKELLELGT